MAGQSETVELAEACSKLAASSRNMQSKPPTVPLVPRMVNRLGSCGYELVVRTRTVSEIQ